MLVTAIWTLRLVTYLLSGSCYGFATQNLVKFVPTTTPGALDWAIFIFSSIFTSFGSKFVMRGVLRLAVVMGVAFVYRGDILLLLIELIPLFGLMTTYKKGRERPLEQFGEGHTPTS
jgi:hypothetical protein